MSSTIIEILGFYIISSIGIYKYLINLEQNEITLIDNLMVLISIPYFPLMWLYDFIVLTKAKYKTNKHIKELKTEIKAIELQLKQETDEQKIKELIQEKNGKETLLLLYELNSVYKNNFKG